MSDILKVILVILSVLTIFFLCECLFCAIFCKGKWRRKKSNKVQDAEQPETIKVAPYQDNNILNPSPSLISHKNGKNFLDDPWEEPTPLLPPPKILGLTPQDDPDLDPEHNHDHDLDHNLDRDLDLDERFNTINRALATSLEVSHNNHFQPSPTRFNVDLPDSARWKHFVNGPFSIQAAEALSNNRGGTNPNTVFEEPQAFDLEFFPGYGSLIVTRHKVRTVQCYGSGEYIGRCYGVFKPGNGHLFYRTSLATREKRPGTVGVSYEAHF